MPGSRPCDPFALAIPAASTANITGPDWINMNSRGVTVVVTTTAIGTGSITLTIEGKDTAAAAANYFTLLVGAAIVTNTTNRYTVFPGAVVAANVSANDELPYQWRLRVTANNANPATYTVGGCTLA